MLPLPVGTLPLAVSADARQLAVSVDMRHLQVWDLEEVDKQLHELGLNWRKDSAVVFEQKETEKTEIFTPRKQR